MCTDIYVVQLIIKKFMQAIIILHMLIAHRAIARVKVLSVGLKGPHFVQQVCLEFGLNGDQMILHLYLYEGTGMSHDTYATPTNMALLPLEC